MNLFPTLSKMYPEGSYQGQCFAFCHKLVKQDTNFPSMPVTIASKKQVLLTNGIPISKLDSIKVGDVLLLNYPIFGHGALVNYINGANLQLTESNFNLDGRVHHTRQISAHSADILGVFRGISLYPLPPVQYPIIKHVLILQNNQPIWNSMINHLSNLQQWFWKASGQRIQIVAHYGFTNLTGWETEFTGPVIGGSNVEIIKESWFDQHVMPLVPQILPEVVAKADIVIFNMKRSDWKGTVFDHPELMELGYCYEKVGMTWPIKIMTISDEHDDYPPYYPWPLSAYAKLMAHEISHGLYGIANNIGEGFDFTHNWFYGQNNYPVDPAGIFNNFDYQKL